MDQIKYFYDRQFLRTDMKHPIVAEQHSFYQQLSDLIEEYELKDKRCLEIGCGFGAFQDLVEDYTGADISDSVKIRLHKPFYQCCASKLPFNDDEFDAIWSIDVLEHISEPEEVLIEMCRALKHRGLLIVKPAWYCRPWAADGYPIRPYRDLNWKGKIVKASIIIRNNIFFRALYLFPKRLFNTMKFIFLNSPIKFDYKELKPNLDTFWMADSDAINSMDPYDAILWFKSRGHNCLNYPTWFKQFFCKTGVLVFQINKS